MRLIQACLIAISMYSKIPVPRVEWKEKNMKYAMCFFPVIGVVIGICMYLAGTFLLRQDVYKRQGYEVRAQIRGLGEMEGIQNLFLEHIEEVM